MVVCDQLGLLREDLDPVQTVRLLHLLDNVLVLAVDLVHLDDRVEPPVGDEEGVLVDDQRERMSDQTGLDCLHVASVQVSVLREKTLKPFEPTGPHKNWQRILRLFHNSAEV